VDGESLHLDQIISSFMEFARIEAGTPGRRREALQLFSEHILHHRLLQRQLRDQLLEPCVLVAQLLHLAGLIYL
jgi:hypothetical protein